MASPLPLDVVERLFLFLEHSTAHVAKLVCREWYWASKRHLPFLCKHKWCRYALKQDMPLRILHHHLPTKNFACCWAPDGVFYWTFSDIAKTYIRNSLQIRVQFPKNITLKFVKHTSHGVFILLTNPSLVGARLCKIEHNGDIQVLVNGCFYAKAIEGDGLLTVSVTDDGHHRIRIIDTHTLKVRKSKVVLVKDTVKYAIEAYQFVCKRKNAPTLSLFGRETKIVLPYGHETIWVCRPHPEEYITLKNHTIQTPPHHTAVFSRTANRLAVACVNGDIYLY